MFNLILFVSFVSRLTSFGITSEYAGTNNTSSNVIASLMIFVALVGGIITMNKKMVKSEKASEGKTIEIFKDSLKGGAYCGILRKIYFV